VGKGRDPSLLGRQWQEFDPSVKPLEVVDCEDGRAEVRVHQLVKSLAGDVLSDSEVWRVYTFTNELIERMELKEDGADPGSSRSKAFARQ
jgi:hypothetical protein